MADGKDIQKKLRGHRRIPEEHRRKEQDHQYNQDEEFAKKTQSQILNEIDILER